jgi:FkbM family methyltransferase
MNIIKRCRHGLMIFNRNDIFQGKSFETYGEYSQSEVDVFTKAVKTGDTIVEVGANMGSHTIPLARLVGPAGTLIAIEPERYCFYILCGNIAINNLKNVFPFQQAFGESTGTVKVPELSQEGNLNVGLVELERDWSQYAHYPVSLNTMDNMNLAKLDFLKIDVEGMEERVLRGGENTIKKFQPIMYIENDRPEKESSLKSYIASLGYEMYTHIAPFWNIDNFYQVKENVFSDLISKNLLCLPKSKKNSINPGDFGMQKITGATTITGTATSKALADLSRIEPGEISLSLN